MDKGFWTNLADAIGGSPDGTPPRSITTAVVEAHFATSKSWNRGPLLSDWAAILLDPKSVPDDFKWHLRYDAPTGTIFVSRRYQAGQIVKPSGMTIRLAHDAIAAIGGGERMKVVQQLPTGWIEVTAAPGHSWPPAVIELHPEDVRVV